MRRNTGGAFVRGRDVGSAGGRSSFRVPYIGDKVEGKKAEVRFMVEGGGGKSTSGSGDTIVPDLLGQEAGGSGGIGGLTAYLRCMRKGYSLLVRGEDQGVMVETGGSGESVEGHVRIDFFRGKVAAVTGI